MSILKNEAFPSAIVQEMEEKTGFETLDATKFFQIIPNREQKFAEASAAPLPKIYPVNVLAKALHPVRQYLVVNKVTELEKDCKCYELVANKEKGTEKIAYFPAGKYLSFFMNINGKDVTRAYSIASSPKEALKGCYKVIIKYVPGGKASRYILDNWTEGTEVTASAPEGTFDYNRLRDAKTMIAVAGGSGITPFLSFAKAVADGDEDFNMILLYGSRTKDSILCKEELDKIEASCDKVKVVHVLSDEEAEGYEKGFITAELIRKYTLANEAYSVFICGPQVMYDFVDKELEKLDLPQKYIRHELYGEIHDATTIEGYPGRAPETVTIKVAIQDKTWTVTGSSRDTILQIMEQNSVKAPSHCRSGECGYCHSRLLSGDVFIPEKMDKRRVADLKYGYIHPCCTFALSDIEIEVPYSK